MTPYRLDDGTVVDPKSVPFPELCRKCKKNINIGEFEVILCNLTRIDQSESKEFKCHSFRI
ncbi:MAG: hypothetical protein KAS62_02120 [Candidatus Delongbacteria bacterium]|nr:hypothetical protein [Candidatus Delongbacteria bacterium]